jgi:hypothetical protein
MIDQIKTRIWKQIRKFLRYSNLYLHPRYTHRTFFRNPNISEIRKQNKKIKMENKISALAIWHPHINPYFCTFGVSYGFSIHYHYFYTIYMTIRIVKNSCLNRALNKNIIHQKLQERYRHIWRTELFNDRSDQDENMEANKKISSVF